ncbi:Meiotically up-regulated protein 86 protein [Paecilomyces lecythidis]|uniref:Meiotically up-regulated protein 86 protein n=1 Tax=Paecilomyces lecythidis TaxID=3004212 RepID=A0ABR3YCU0_9EURO
MWEMAVGNTFGATSLSSYGGFWISYAIILTPGGFHIQEILSTDSDSAQLYNSLDLYLMSTVAFFLLFFFLLFFFLDIAFLLLAIGNLVRPRGTPDTRIKKAGGLFALLAAFTAWYNALAGIADTSNSFFIIPVVHFPWSATGREKRLKTERETA